LPKHPPRFAGAALADIMTTHIKYTEAEKASFAIVPETCPAVERAIDEAFATPSFSDEGIAVILGKYEIALDRNMRNALNEIVSRFLFDRKRSLADVVLYEGTFPLRAALVREVERSRGMVPGRNHFEEWISSHKCRNAARTQAA
jgi:hypothetical protein